MRLTLVTGRSGCGKTEYIYQSICKQYARGRECVLIVPDDATYEAERQLMERLGGSLTGAQVLGFTRLAQRVLERAGGRSRVTLKPEGKRMALRRLITQNADALSLYGAASARSGFVQKADELISAFRFSRVSPEQLRSAAQSVGDGMLGAKLSDIAVIYSAFDEFMASKWTDNIGAQELMIQKLPEAQFIKDAHIFIDGFFSFTTSAQIYEIIRLLIAHSACVTVAASTCAGGGSLFEGEAAFAKRLAQCASELGASVDEVALDEFMRPSPPAVRAIEAELFAEGSGTLRPDGLTLYRALNPRAEIEMAAWQIFRLIKNGARCRDIAVALGSAQEYASYLKRELTSAGLPCFMDESRPLASHPVVETLMASLSAALNNYRAQDVLRAAKSGYSPLTGPEAETLEDYAKRYNIRFSGFAAEFTKGRDAFPDFEEAERARAKLMAPIGKLSRALADSKTAEECCASLYTFMLDIDVFSQLFESKGYFLQDDAFYAENAQVYDAIIDLLDQIALMMPGPMPPRRFVKVLEEGFAAHNIGVVPQTTDSILIGPLQKVAMRNVKHLLVLGCNEGLIPALPPTDGIINDSDVDKLRLAGIDAFNYSSADAARENYSVYACLSRPTASLYVSCALHDAQGAPLPPSSLMERLEALFPGACHPVAPELPYGEKAGLGALIADMRRLADGEGVAPYLESRFAYYMGSPWRGTLEASLRGLFETPSGMTAEDAQALYGDWSAISPSRLEKFNSCPFSHLVQYGLKPDIPRPYEPEALDFGNYYHAAFDMFFKHMAEEGLDYYTLDEGACSSMLDAILDAIEQNHREGLFTESARSRTLAKRMRRGAKRTLWAAVNQIRSGNYRPVGSEIPVGLPGKGPVKLPPLELTLESGRKIYIVGKIDRVDSCGDSIRIIDYKTGDEKFSFESLYAGTKLQLPLYLRAAERLGRGAGIFYMRAFDPELEEGGGEQAEYRLRGVVVDDPEVLRAMDGHSTGFSHVIPVRFTKDGASGSGLISGSGMELLLDFACAKAAATAERIENGENAPQPLRTGDRTSCQYCDYSSVCRYEASSMGRRTLLPMKADEFFELAGSSASSTATGSEQGVERAPTDGDSNA